MHLSRLIELYSTKRVYLNACKFKIKAQELVASQDRMQNVRKESIALHRYGKTSLKEGESCFPNKFENELSL